MTFPSFSVASRVIGSEFRVFTDPRAAESGQLLIVLDGDDQFAAAADAAREINSRRGASLVPVGVGYGGSYRSPVNKRARDYTPTKPKDEPMEVGGADAFLAFIGTELLPALHARLRLTDDILLGGHSLGSLFALYALTRPTSPFTGYLISSPSIWWDDRSVLASFGNSASANWPSTRRAFLSVGLDDTPSMTGDLTLLEQQLAHSPPPQLRYRFERFAGKDHINVLSTAYMAGLDWLVAGSG